MTVVARQRVTRQERMTRWQRLSDEPERCEHEAWVRSSKEGQQDATLPGGLL